jgi:hypothetical protein
MRELIKEKGTADMDRRFQMNRRLARLVCVLPLVVTVSACSSSNPLQPSVAAPRPLQPANGAQIAYANQPVTLVVTNATSTGTGALPYTFEVATDAAFTAKVSTIASVAQGANGQTSVQLGTLAGGSDYYWHASAGTGGLFSAPFKLTIGPAIKIGMPTPVAPLNGTTSTGWPTFTVNDPARSGPVGSLVYRFDIATIADFSSIVLTATVPETTGQTSFTPPTSQPAPPQTALFWRATAIDPVNVIASVPSPTQAFTFSVPPSQAAIIAGYEGVVLWPGVQPPGTNGHATLGDHWDVANQTSFNGVVFLSPTIDEIRTFDLLDRGLDPQSAIDWMHANGYPNGGAWYPTVAVIGFPYEYMAFINGRWDLVVKVGA